MKLDPLVLLAGQAERQVEQTSAAIDLAFGFALFKNNIADDNFTFSQDELNTFVSQWKVIRTIDDKGNWTIKIQER